MIKKLVKHGNSIAIILDKAVLELLKIDANTKIELTTDGTNLIISPINEDDSSIIKKSIDKINKQHEKTLRKLAEWFYK